MPLAELAQQVWKMCDDYVRIAQQHLVMGVAQLGPQEDKSSVTTFDAIPEFLRIHFLFPRIAQQGFQQLIELRQTRWMLMAVMKNDEPAKTIRSAHTVEQLEAKHEEAKRDIEMSLEAFSPVQREILREKFIGISPAE